jgi:hypothetical protein
MLGSPARTRHLLQPPGRQWRGSTGMIRARKLGYVVPLAVLITGARSAWLWVFWS